jgi:hypothetical protein
MKKLLCISTAILIAASAAGCNSSDPGDRAVAGGLIGAATGAAVGGLATGKWGGAAAGAAIGGVGGAVVGAATAPQQREPQCARWGRDYYGNPVCTQYYR